PDPWQLAALRDVDAVLVSDYGRGLAAKQRVREALARCARRMPVVWDPHPRGPEPVAGSALVTPNRSEAQAFAARGHGVGRPRETELAAIAAQAAALRDLWGARGVAVTMGSGGALLVTEGVLPMAIPARERVLGDPCGAGDQF